MSTPEKVLEWVKGVASQHGFGMRRDAFDPGPRFADEDFGHDVCWNRDDVVRSAVSYFQQAVATSVIGSTQHNGLCATLASRGCGKSFIVDHLCRLHNARDEGQRLVLEDQLNDRLVPVCISFNGPQSLAVDGELRSHEKIVRASLPPQALLFSRIAHRVFLNGDPATWGQFSRETASTWNRVDPDNFFRALLLCFEQLGVASPVILLAVDEVIKCGESVAVEILAICKSFLDSFTRQCRLLVTTFDDHQLVDGGTVSPRVQPVEKRARTAGSQRPIDWLPLLPLDVANPRAVLAPLRQFEDKQLDFLISLSGGHPRSLALLKAELSRRDQRSLAQVASDWQDQVALFVNAAADEVIEELLAKTLLGETIGIEDDVAGASVRSLVQDTVILNALDPKRHPRFVPQLSLLRLRHWCEQGEDNLRVRLRTLLELGHNLQHRSFEEFHAIFEEMRCWAWHKLKKGEDVTLRKWIPKGKFIRGGELRLVVPDPQLQKTETLPNQLSQYRGSLQRCYVAHDNQPGFDVVQPMGGSLLLYECRYSEPPMSEDKTGTKLTPSEDVRRKSVLAQQEVEASKTAAGGQTIDPSQSAYILIGHRDSVQDLELFAKTCNEKPADSYMRAVAMWEKFSKLEMSVAVLNRQALLLHYGPTFKLLGGFMLDYSARNHK